MDFFEQQRRHRGTTLKLVVLFLFAVIAVIVVIDAIVEPQHLRAEIIRRFAQARGKDRTFSDRRHGVPPV